MPDSAQETQIIVAGQMVIKGPVAAVHLTRATPVSLECAAGTTRA